MCYIGSQYAHRTHQVKTREKSLYANPAPGIIPGAGRPTVRGQEKDPAQSDQKPRQRRPSHPIGPEAQE